MLLEHRGLEQLQYPHGLDLIRAERMQVVSAILDLLYLSEAYNWES